MVDVFFQAEDGIRDLVRSRGLGDVYKRQVPLKKELQFIKHYIELEKLRFGENLDLRFNIRGEIQNYRIAPLLLLPLVENAFKHGVSETIEQPWLSIDIDIQNDQLKCRVLNSKFPGNFSSNSGEGNGIKNLKQRLDLI